MIIGFVTSIIIFGIGCGLAFCGSLDFKVLKDNEGMITTKTTTFEMNNQLIINSYEHDINYIESDNNDIKLEYKANKVCELVDINYENNIELYFDYDDPINIVKETINNLKNKKIIPITCNAYELNIYSNKNNIDILKNNYQKELERRKEYEDQRTSWEREIDELREENLRLNDRINELENNE